MIENNYKEVYFSEYCSKCKHKDTAETDTPCSECLADPVNLYSHKPVCFEASDKKTNKKEDI